jgi:tetratricopeptide (TPR) repeat protein
MAFRFFRRFRIAPGITLNLSKSGPSLSFGPRGAKATLGPRGLRQTLGLTGTGLFYTKHTSWSAKPGKGRQNKAAAGPSPTAGTGRLDLGFFKRLFTPKDEQAFVDGLKAFVQGNETAALDTFVTTLHLSDAAFMAGFIAYKRENYTQALDCFEHAHQRQDGLGKHFAKYGLDLVLTLPITDELDAHVRPRRRGLLLGMAEVLQELGEHFRAAELLMELRSLEPEDVVVKVSLAELLFEARPDDPKTCHEIVRMAGDVRNESAAHAALMLYKAKALRAQGLFTAARDTLTAALRRTKDRGKDLLLALRYERALVYADLNQHKRSRTELEKIFAQHAEYEDVRERLKVSGV